MSAVILYLTSMLIASPLDPSGFVPVDVLERSRAGVEVDRWMADLRQSSRWTVRKKAAHRLRDFNWQLHPGIAEALAEALRADGQGLVRIEAAKSLGKLKPCLPIVHEAVASAARKDRSLLVRLASKKALKRLDRNCDAPCDVCDFDEFPNTVDDIDGQSLPIEPSIVPNVPSTELEALDSTSMDLPVSPPARSAFTPSIDPPFADRPAVRPFADRFEDATRLVPPVVPLDRYNPRPADPAPTPLGDDAVAPRPNWRGILPE